MTEMLMSAVLGQMLRGAQAGLAAADVRSSAKVRKAYRRGHRAGRSLAWLIGVTCFVVGAVIGWWVA